MNSVTVFFKNLTLDEWNFLIAFLALLLSLYSIYYTRKCNRRKLKITADTVFSDEPDFPIHWFTIHNLSAVSTTIWDIRFFSVDGHPIQPLAGYEPKQTYSPTDPFHSDIPDIIPDYKYPNQLNGELILYPQSSEEFGYYFDTLHTDIKIEVSALERIHHFRKHQTFLVHFSDIQN